MTRYATASNTNHMLDEPRDRKPTTLELYLGNIAEDLALERIESDLHVGEAFCETNDGTQFRSMLALRKVPQYWADAAMRYLAAQVVSDVMARPIATKDCLDYVTWRAYAALGVDPLRSAAIPLADSPGAAAERSIPVAPVGSDIPTAGAFLSTDRSEAA